MRIFSQSVISKSSWGKTCVCLKSQGFLLALYMRYEALLQLPVTLEPLNIVTQRTARADLCDAGCFQTEPTVHHLFTELTVCVRRQSLQIHVHASMWGLQYSDIISQGQFVLEGFTLHRATFRLPARCSDYTQSCSSQIRVKPCRGMMKLLLSTSSWPDWSALTSSPIMLPMQSQPHWRCGHVNCKCEKVQEIQDCIHKGRYK